MDYNTQVFVWLVCIVVAGVGLAYLMFSSYFRAINTTVHALQHGNWYRNTAEAPAAAGGSGNGKQ
jgi:hypothetical protein